MPHASGNLTGLGSRGPTIDMPPTILIAEDYDDNRELLRLLLAGANYQVREARNGQECLDLACENPPDLIMVDLSMPELDGWEVFKALKANSLTAHIPCVAVTAHTDRDRARPCNPGSVILWGSRLRPKSCC